MEDDLAGIEPSGSSMEIDECMSVRRRRSSSISLENPILDAQEHARSQSFSRQQAVSQRQSWKSAKDPLPLLKPQELYSPDWQRAASPEDGCPLQSSGSSSELSSPLQSKPLESFLQDTDARQSRLLGFSSDEPQGPGGSEQRNLDLMDLIPALALIEPPQLASPPPTRLVSNSASPEASSRSDSRWTRTLEPSSIGTGGAQNALEPDSIEAEGSSSPENKLELHRDSIRQSRKRSLSASYLSKESHETDGRVFRRKKIRPRKA